MKDEYAEKFTAVYGAFMFTLGAAIVIGLGQELVNNLTPIYIPWDDWSWGVKLPICFAVGLYFWIPYWEKRAK